MYCLEERNDMEEGLRNLSRLISDDLSYSLINSLVFLLQSLSTLQPAAEDSWEPSPGIWQPRVPACWVGIALSEVHPSNKGALLVTSRPWESPALKDGVEIMWCKLGYTHNFSNFIFFQTEPEWHVVETNRHLQKGSVYCSEVFRPNSKPDVECTCPARAGKDRIWPMKNHHHLNYEWYVNKLYSSVESIIFPWWEKCSIIEKLD